MTATAESLWASVKASYPADSIRGLTNPFKAGNSGSDDTVGVDAARSFFGLFLTYAQAEYNDGDPAHVEAGKLGVIAILKRRGGAVDSTARKDWDEVFGPGGLLVKIKETGPRARITPETSSSRHPLQAHWTERRSLPRGILPVTRRRRYDYDEGRE